MMSKSAHLNVLVIQAERETHMLCPRCGAEGDVSKSPCPRCGLQVRLPHQSRGATRAQTSSPKQSTALPPLPQPGSDLFQGRQSTALPPLPQPDSDLFQMNRTSTTISGSGIRSSKEGTEPLNPFAPVTQQPGASMSSPNFDPLASSGFSRSSGISFPTSARTSGPARIDSQSSPGQLPNTTPFVDRTPAKNIPPRPQTPIPPSPVTPVPGTEIGRISAPLRPSRLVNEKEGIAARTSAFQSASPETSVPSGSLASGSLKDQRLLMPGTLLRNGRYRLRELQGRQDWFSGVYEAMWVAQDAQRSGSQVMICELAVPESGTMMVQSMLRTATMALTSVGRHPRIPTLWDAFSDQGQNFFVFEPLEGESLLARMRRTGRPLSEQEVVECCLQTVELLDLLIQQSPPLVHGLIRPEHVVINLAGNQYFLTNFSVIMAGGATQLISGIDRSQLSPFMAPELSRGGIDPRFDLYSLLATAYYAVTGNVPNGNNGTIIPSAQKLNPSVSAAFDAILMKGLRPIANQRYQHPIELRQDLLGLHSVSGSIAPKNEALVSGQARPRPAQVQSVISVSSPTVQDSVAQMLPGMLATGLDDESEVGMTLPKPEDLPPLAPRNDMLPSLIWLVGILVCLIAIVIASRGLL
jgi:ribosomal protein L37E